MENRVRERERDDHAEKSAKAKAAGWVLFLLSLLLLLAQATYNWKDIAELNAPPLFPPSNLMGIFGARYAWIAYEFCGLAAWLFPLFPMTAGISLAMGRRLRPLRRTALFAVLLLSGSCLAQLWDDLPGIAALKESSNFQFAGGTFGYLAVTRGLSTVFSPFGTGLIAGAAFVLSALALAGARNIVSLAGRIVSWAAERDEPSGAKDAEEDPLADERRRSQIEAAREEARLAREEERRRRSDEKEAERRRKAEEKERERQEREAAKERERQERAAAAEAERLRSEREAQERREASIAQARAKAEEDAARERAEAEERRRTEEAAARERRLAAEAAAAQPQTAGAESEEGGEAGASEKKPYVLPSIDLLNPVPDSCAEHGDMEEMARRIMETLRQFGVETTLAFTTPGPVVTQYALTPAPNVKVERITALSGNLQMALEAKSLRIEAPIPGKNAVGLEVPNRKASPVWFRAVAEGKTWNSCKFQVPLLLGKDAAGNDLVADLARLPHLLVAGATGQGKSVCLNSIITGLLMCRTPEQLRFILIDPKRVEFTTYQRLPHLLVPVINDTKKVVFGLRWAVKEMEKRLRMFAKAKCKNIVDFNTREISVQQDFFAGGEEKESEFPRTIPYIVIIIDEVADIMMSAGKEVEPVIARLTALARATGIHLILATQRPDTKTITGTIKSNIPGRIAFKTSQSVDSRTILDSQGAEDLIGKGDMLYRTPEGALLRAQGAYLANEEIERVVDFIGEHADVNFDEEFTARLDKIKEADPDDALEDEEGGDGEDGGGRSGRGGSAGGGAPEPPPEPAEPLKPINEMDAPTHITTVKELELYNQAIEILRSTKRASTSYLQRRMGIGYTHAARLVDILEETGIVGPARGSGSREILVDLENFVPLTADDLPALSAAGGRPIDPAAFVAAHGGAPLSSDGE